jgi:3-phosphoglycerate kinase
MNNIQNKIVLLRCDFNEPIITDTKNNTQTLVSTKRIDANISTIHELLSRKNKVVLISHHSDKGQTLLPVYNYLKDVFGHESSKLEINYVNNVDEKVVSEYFLQNKNNLSDIVLIENTRLFFGENAGSFAAGIHKEIKNLDEENNIEFAKFLASLGEVFVYDAFSVGHRDHASTTGIAKLLPSFFGTTFEREHKSLSKVLNNINHSLVIMGGAKLSTKLPIIEKFLAGGATVCVGGAMVHPILQAENIDIKNSYLEKGYAMPTDEMNTLLEYIKSEKLILPDHFSWASSSTGKSETGDGAEKIVDSIFDNEKLQNIIEKNNIKNILWNGPVGMYEEGDVEGSTEIYKLIKNNKNLFTVLGGGDTLTMLESLDFDFEENFSYVSLSGGAMLTFLAEGTLPILKNIKN